MSCCVGIMFSHGKLPTSQQTSVSGNGDLKKTSEDGAQLPTWRRSLKTVAHAILSTLCGVPVLVHVQVCVQLPGDPQGVQLSRVTLQQPPTYTLAALG